MGKIEDKDIDLHIDRETLLQEYIPKAQYEARLKAEREKIAKDVANKMSYMGTCLNERNIILGIITGKRETLDSLCSICKSECCVSNHTALSKSDYEARLKADMVAMLEDLKLDIEYCVDAGEALQPFEDGVNTAKNQVLATIDERINRLRG